MRRFRIVSLTPRLLTAAYTSATPDFEDAIHYESASARRAHQRHSLWIIQNRSEADLAGSYATKLDPDRDDEVYAEAKKSWLHHIKSNPKNLAILSNAANFFLFTDQSLAEDLLIKVQDLEPNNPKWADRLGSLYESQMIGKSGEAKRAVAVKALAVLDKALSGATTGIERIDLLFRLGEVALEADHLEKAKLYTSELLSKVPPQNENWLYAGIVHDASIILGRVVLREGNIDKAKEYLIAAGRVPGS